MQFWAAAEEVGQQCLDWNLATGASQFQASLENTLHWSLATAPFYIKLVTSRKYSKSIRKTFFESNFILILNLMMPFLATKNKKKTDTDIP